jgi:hypothetical protein
LLLLAVAAALGQTFIMKFRVEAEDLVGKTTFQ